MLKYIALVLSLIISVTISAQEDYKYRVKIDASPLLQIKNGTEKPGKARVRIELEGTEGVAITGKQMEGDIRSITFRDEPIGKILMVTISIEGVYWSKRIDIDEVLVSVTDDEDETKKYPPFSCGCTLTKGNSTISIDRGGPIGFAADEAAIALEDEMFNQIDLDGEFTYSEVEGSDGFSISKEKAASYQKELEETIDDSDDKRICTTKVVEASASFDVNFLTNPSTSSLYPGALIYAESMADGSYVNISGARRPITLSTNIAVIGSPLIEVETPKLSTIRAAMNDLLVSQERGEIQIQANFEISEVYSKEQLSIALGGHFAYGGGSVNVDFNYDSEEETTVKVIKFAQKYYTIDMDQPDSPFDVFQNERDALDVLQSGQTPLYVSSVTYGRMAYFFLETSMSSSEIKAHLDAAYESVAVEASAYGDLEIAKLLEQSKMSALIIGGDSSQPISAVDGVEGFKDMLRDGGTLSPTSLGVPISYIARYLSDSQVARTNLLTTYTERNCREVVGTSESVTVSLASVGMSSMAESDSELGYSLKIQLLGADKLAKETLLEKQVDEEHLLKFVETGIKSQKVVNTFDYEIADLNNLYVRVTANITEFDPGIVGDNKWSSEEEYSLAELIGAADNPTPTTFVADNGDDVVTFDFQFKSAGAAKVPSN